MSSRRAATIAAFSALAACARPPPPAPPPYEPLRLSSAPVLSFATAEATALPAAEMPPSEAPKAPSLHMDIEPPFKIDARPAETAEELRARWKWNQGGMGDLAKDPPPVEGHPLPRVVIDVQRATGARSTQAAQALLRAKYWIHTIHCYQLAAYKTQDLRGDATIEFDVPPSGKPRAGRSLSSTLPSEVDGCLAREVTALDFGPAKSGARIVANIHVGAGDDPMPPPADAIEPGDGVLSPEAMRAPVEAAREELQRCYEEALGYAPHLWGRLAIRFHVTKRGAVTEAFETESRFPDERVARCVLRAARQLSFERPKGGDLRFVVALRLWTDDAGAPAR